MAIENTRLFLIFGKKLFIAQPYYYVGLEKGKRFWFAPGPGVLENVKINDPISPTWPPSYSDFNLLVHTAGFLIGNNVAWESLIHPTPRVG